MKAQICFVLLALAAGAQARVRPTAPLVATIEGGRQSAPVSRYEYGMFIEPIDNLVARSLWAEMLDDRKFYFPVLSEAKDAPAPPTVEGRPGASYRKWRPVGGDNAVVMDTANPFVGKHSASVAVEASAPRGLQQSGLGVARGKRYDGYVWLSGDPIAEVQVALVWGSGPNDRQAITLPAPAAEWRKVAFSFTPSSDSGDARLEITGIGNGRFRVGAVSLMPADNIDGWRADTTAIARSLHSGFWRLPGGNFLSDCDWHLAIGPRDKRPPIFDRAWGAMQPNDIGMDEWLELARLIGVEPYVTVNAGLGDANSAAEEVEYLNGPASSEWGSKRAANGHPQPYRVKFWNIGNEPYGWWQIGKTSLEYFMMKHNEFAERMRAIDPSIVLIGSGAMPDQMKPRDVKENPSLESIQHKFGTEEDWTGGLLAKAWGNFDGLSEHWYDRAEQRPNVPPDEELLEWARSPSNQVRMKADEWAIYERQFPKIKADHIFLFIDEYAYFGPPNLKLSLAYAMVFQEMLRHSDFLRMAAFTTGASTMDITPTDAVLNSTGMVFRLYGEHFAPGTIPLAVSGNSPQPAPKHDVGYEHPQVRAGSPTWPLDILAGLSPDGRTLRIGIVNATLEPQWVAIKLKELRTRGDGTEWQLTGATLDAKNKVGAPPGVTIQPVRVRPLGPSLTVPAKSASIFEYSVATRR